MAKRFTDSEKWKKRWFRQLPIGMKLLWVYICDNCNIAGVWDVDLELAEFMIGVKIDESEALEKMGKQIQIINGSKWLVKDFVPFQYGDLVPNNNLHRSVIRILNESGANEGLVSPWAGDKVKVKDKVKENQKKNIILETLPASVNKNISIKKYDFDLLWIKYPNRVGRKAALAHFAASVRTDQDFADIQTALDNYLHCETVGKGFVQNGSTWFNNWRDWIVPPKQKGMDLPESLRKFL